MTGPSQGQSLIERKELPRPTGYRDGTPRWVDEMLESDTSSRPSTTTSQTIPGVVVPLPRVTTPERGIGTSPVSRTAEGPMHTPSTPQVEPAVTMTSPQQKSPHPAQSLPPVSRTITLMLPSVSP